MPQYAASVQDLVVAKGVVGGELDSLGEQADRVDEPEWQPGGVVRSLAVEGGEQDDHCETRHRSGAT